MMATRATLLWLGMAGALGACGSKTDLAIGAAARDAGRDGGRRDAGLDAGVDAGVDGGPDGGFCEPGNVPLRNSTVEVVFVVDRSGSMRAAFDGLPPGPGELSRWELLETAMADALSVFDAEVGIGGKFFPSRSDRPVEDDCAVFDGLEVPIGPGRAAGVIAQFARFNPAGGTPLGPATREALDALIARADPTRAQFIVVATDGAPTCGFDAVSEALAVIGEAHSEHGVDVFVVGIASTEREIDLLDVMAVEGGRARPSAEASRFYDARDPDLLMSLLGEITRDLAQCVFSVPFPPGEEDVVEVILDGDVLPRDVMREQGWDWTSERRTQLSLFGDACERARLGGAVRAIITCG